MTSSVGWSREGSQASLLCPSLSSCFTELWCSPNGGRGTSSSSSGRSFCWCPHHPHEGEGGRHRQRHRQFQRRLLFRLDAHRARRDRALLRCPLGARTVEPATDNS